MKFHRLSLAAALVVACTGLNAQTVKSMKPIDTADAAIAAAHEDAVKRLGVKAKGTAMELLTADTVMWPDAGLGCPKPGLSYTQATVPGYRVRMLVGGETWDYHLSRRGVVVLCPKGAGNSGQGQPVRPDSRI